MCITFFYISPNNHPHKHNIKFLVAFNREENVSRNTKSLDFFEEDANIIGGRDLKAKGTWLGYNKKTQNIAFLTKVFNPALINPLKTYQSRGSLVHNFLKTGFFKENGANLQEIREFLREIHLKRAEFAPFHLVLGNLQLNSFFYYGNHASFGDFVQIQSGVYSMCNFEKFFETCNEREKLGVEYIEEFLVKNGKKSEIVEEIALLMRGKHAKKPGNQRKAAVFQNIPFLTTLTSSVFVIDHENRAVFKEITYFYRFPLIARVLGLAPQGFSVKEIEINDEEIREKHIKMHKFT